LQTPFDPSHPADDKWLREPLDDEERQLIQQTMLGVIAAHQETEERQKHKRPAQSMSG
jgi:hypothetical protein